MTAAGRINEKSNKELNMLNENERADRKMLALNRMYISMGRPSCGGLECEQE